MHGGRSSGYGDPRGSDQVGKGVHRRASKVIRAGCGITTPVQLHLGQDPRVIGPIQASYPFWLRHCLWCTHTGKVKAWLDYSDEISRLITSLADIFPLQAGGPSKRGDWIGSGGACDGGGGKRGVERKTRDSRNIPA